MIVGSLRWSRIAVLIAAVALFASACGNGEADLASPEETTPVTSSVQGSEDVVQEPAAADAPAVVDYSPITVQLDATSSPSDEEVRNLLFAAVKADHDNGLWCWANTTSCIETRHLGPAVVDARFEQLSGSLQAYRGENGIYQAGDLDGIFPVEINPTLDTEFNNGFRVLGQVFACEAYNGVYFVPDANGGVGQVLNDAPAGFITEFSVWQGEDGGLRTANRAITEKGGLELCDQHRG